MANFTQMLEQQAQAMRKQETAKASWDAYMAQLKKWRDTCHESTCDGCDMHRHRCICLLPATPSDIVEMLRHLAGINPTRRVARPIHDEDQFRGVPGPRSCGINSWDNAVRAHEEDR